MTVIQKCYKIVNEANKKYENPVKFTSLQNPYCFVTDEKTGACQCLDVPKFHCAKAFLDSIALLSKKEKEDILTNVPGMLLSSLDDKIVGGSSLLLDSIFEAFRHIGEKKSRK